MSRRGVLPEDDDKRAAVTAMFDGIAPRYDLVNRVMTLGLDVRWRRRAVAALDLLPDSLVADVACGTGDFCRELESAGHRAIGFDLSAGMLSYAPRALRLVRADALRLPVASARVDGVTCGFALRNVVDLAALAEELARVTRSGGRMALLEVATPRSAVLRAAHGVYFRRAVPLIGGLLSDRAAYRYLPASTAYLPGGDELRRLLANGGWRDVAIEPVGLGAAQIVTGTRR